MNTTWSFLLLFLSTITGRETKSEVKGCREGWLEFTCEYQKRNGKYTSVEVHAKNKLIRSTKKDMWEYEGRFSLYHDTENKNFRVAIKQLQSLDDGRYWCEFYQGSRPHHSTKELELEADEDCQSPFTHTAYKSATITITCDFPENTYNFSVKFFCKENHSTCEDILPTKYSLKPKVTLAETNSGFNISISKVSSQHAGVYWCGVESNERRYRAALRKIQLKVEDISNFKRSPTIGQNFTYWCGYPEGAPRNKFICKGEDTSTCKPLVNTTQLNLNPGKFSMKDDKDQRNITITVINITKEDIGTYWCGAVSTDPRRSNPFFHRFVMTVVPPSPTSPVSSTQSTTVSTGSQIDLADSHQVIIIVVVCVSVLLLLLLVLILILIYKRHFKNKRNAAQHIKEDYVYEEIQEHPQKPDSGHAMNFPTNPSDSLHYSTVSFKNCSGEAGGEGLITRPCNSACEYSTVKDSQSPTNSTVNQTSSEDPLYSTVYKPQKQ
ncbi:polymeric immunoglobulin receptor-like [Epinephelus lanceolatus]|uniref:polymeric immunoglobulin receptor-like n=1 Tax=Epinephelus lanceolatus TaxID=310571 RepID=UPI0014480B33|nr:polymeric immunoglobulin receptor-like [Epinephelus lanceolatus]